MKGEHEGKIMKKLFSVDKKNFKAQNVEINIKIQIMSTELWTSPLCETDEQLV